MSALPEQYVSLKEYFALEKTSEIKHEYHQGRIFAMTGASLNHNVIVMALGINLGNQLDKKPCQPYPSDFRLKIETADIYTYPDLSVICSDVQLADGRQDTYLNPTVLMEVLSDSMEVYDRGKKFEYYRTIPSLREYLLIAQDRPHVERYRRQHQHWLFSDYATLHDEVPLDSIGCTLALSVIYARVRFET